MKTYKEETSFKLKRKLKRVKWWAKFHQLRRKGLIRKKF